MLTINGAPIAPLSKLLGSKAGVLFLELDGSIAPTLGRGATRADVWSFLLSASSGGGGPVGEACLCPTAVVAGVLFKQTHCGGTSRPLCGTSCHALVPSLDTVPAS